MKKIALSDSNAVKEAVRILGDGGVVMHPTETCYGLAVDIFNSNALERLYRIKEMSLDKPVSIMVDSLGMALKYGIFPGKALALAHAYWPGPLSIVVPRKRSLPEFLNRDNDFVSIRHSSLGFCSDLPGVLGRPVTTTSANKSGEPQFYEPCDLKGVDLIIDGGMISGNKPSTIVRVFEDKLEILRQGDIVLGE